MPAPTTCATGHCAPASGPTLAGHCDVRTRLSTNSATCPWCAAPKTRWRACKTHIRNTQHRVLLLAESDGRRESLLDFLRASGVNPPAFDSLLEFQASDEPLGIATAGLTIGFSWLEDGLDFVTETELFAAGPTTRRRKKQEQVSDVEALIKDLAELNVGDPVVHSAHGIGRYRGLINLDLGEKNADGSPARAGVSAPRIRRQGHAVCAGQPVAADQPLHRRQRRRGPAAQAGQRPVGKGQAQGRRAGARRQPPSCSTSTPAAPRARAMPSATRRRTTKALPTTSASRKPPTRTLPSTP